MTQMTNSAAVRILKEISTDKFRSHDLNWPELTADLGFPPDSSAVKNISKRNGYWPDIVKGEPYDWVARYRECFEKYARTRGCASTVAAIESGIEDGRLADAATERFKELVGNAEGVEDLPGEDELPPELHAILDYIVEMSVGGRSALERARSAADAENSQGDASRIGFVDAYWNPTEAQYWKKISDAKKRIDIIHFHGLSWTNTNREFLVKQLENPDLRIRVALLDPESPFFAPYAEFIGIDPEVLESKYMEVVSIWERMLKEAAELGETARFSLCKYLGFPAKSIYRFDDSLLITPTTNAQPKSQFVAILAEKKADPNVPCAFRAYMQEVEWIMENGKTVLSSTQ